MSVIVVLREPQDPVKVWAARAAELAIEDKQVLVCTYNITLMNYLRDLVARHARSLANQQVMPSQVTRQRIEYRNLIGVSESVLTMDTNGIMINFGRTTKMKKL